MNNDNPITVQKRKAAARKKQKPGEVVQLQNGVVIEIHETMREASKKGFNYSSIKDCCEHRYKHHKGFQWMFKNDYDNLLSNKSKNESNPDTD